MAPLAGSTISGYNSLLGEQKTRKKDVLFSTVVFNDSITTVHDRVPVAEVPELTEKDYDPCGCTALLDAVGQTVMHIDSMHRSMPEGTVPTTMVFIITDGYENASRYHTYDSVKKMIRDRETGGWTFKYLGSEIDVRKEASRIGIGKDDAIEFDHSEEGMRLCCNSISCCMDDMMDR